MKLTVRQLKKIIKEEFKQLALPGIKPGKSQLEKPEFDKSVIDYDEAEALRYAEPDMKDVPYGHRMSNWAYGQEQEDAVNITRTREAEARRSR